MKKCSEMLPNYVLYIEISIILNGYPTEVILLYNILTFVFCRNQHTFGSELKRKLNLLQQHSKERNSWNSHNECTISKHFSTHKQYSPIFAFDIRAFFLIFFICLRKSIQSDIKFLFYNFFKLLRKKGKKKHFWWMDHWYFSNCKIELAPAIFNNSILIEIWV